MAIFRGHEKNANYSTVLLKQQNPRSTSNKLWDVQKLKKDVRVKFKKRA